MWKMYIFLMCRPCSGAKNSPSRGWEAAEFPVYPTTGGSCATWMGKASRASPDPYPCVPRGGCQGSGRHPRLWPGPRSLLFLGPLGIAVTPRATARALGSKQHHGTGGNGTFGSKIQFFPKQGVKRAGRKSRAKTTEGVGV